MPKPLQDARPRASGPMRALVLLVAVGAVALPPVTTAAPPAGRDFYVSPSGSDTSAGTSPAAPWKTLAKAESTALRAGDRVHLEGGATFGEPLAPYAGTTATSRVPIVFDSYGSGKATLAAGIYLNSVSYLAFENLNVASTGKGVFSSAAGTGAREITLRNLTLSDVPLAGISSNNRADDQWLIEHVSIARTGDSGIFFLGSNFTIAGCSIVDTGTEAAIPYPRHGIYAAGPAPTIVDNTITRFSTSGVSLRLQNGVVAGNHISSGVRGVSFEDQATAVGTTRIVYNTISDVSDSGVVVARVASENFVVANNTIVGAGRYGIYFQTVPSLTIANNIVRATGPGANLLSVRPPTTTYREHHDLWFGGSGAPFYWNGTSRTFAGYQQASGQGAADLTGDPQLGPDLAPRPGSPAIDAGSTSIAGSLDFAAACDGQRFHYCGAAPDLGSSEQPAGVKDTRLRAARR